MVACFCHDHVCFYAAAWYQAFALRLLVKKVRLLPLLNSSDGTWPSCEMASSSSEGGGRVRGRARSLRKKLVAPAMVGAEPVTAAEPQRVGGGPDVSVVAKLKVHLQDPRRDKERKERKASPKERTRASRKVKERRKDLSLPKVKEKTSRRGSRILG